MSSPQPLRFTFPSTQINIPESVKSPESWSQRYSTSICLVLTTIAGFMAGYSAGRYSKK